MNEILEFNGNDLSWCWLNDWYEGQRDIEYIGSIRLSEVLPVVHGKWEQVDDYRYPCGCTKCRKTFSGRYNFCPNCGAVMREAE